jgi:hypothetical protein
MNYPNGARNQK